MCNAGRHGKSACGRLCCRTAAGLRDRLRPAQSHFYPHQMRWGVSSTSRPCVPDGEILVWRRAWTGSAKAVRPSGEHWASRAVPVMRRCAGTPTVDRLAHGGDNVGFGRRRNDPRSAAPAACARARVCTITPWALGRCRPVIGRAYDASVDVTSYYRPVGPWSSQAHQCWRVAAPALAESAFRSSP
jgi:hypothetical protein